MISKALSREEICVWIFISCWKKLRIKRKLSFYNLFKKKTLRLGAFARDEKSRLIKIFKDENK
jgi:hypothetical protein